MHATFRHPSKARKYNPAKQLSYAILRSYPFISVHIIRSVLTFKPRQQSPETTMLRHPWTANQSLFKDSKFLLLFPAANKKFNDYPQNTDFYAYHWSCLPQINFCKKQKFRDLSLVPPHPPLKHVGNRCQIRIFRTIAISIISPVTSKRAFTRRAGSKIHILAQLARAASALAARSPPKIHIFRTVPTHSKLFIHAIL